MHARENNSRERDIALFFDRAEAFVSRRIAAREAHARPLRHERASLASHAR